MKLALVILVGSASVAHAQQAAFDEYSLGVRPRTASQLFEASCDLKIELRGPIATYEVKQRLSNAGPDDLAASLELPLPRGAQVIGFSANGTAALVVPADSPSIVGGSAVLGVDPAMLVRGMDDRYRVIAQPFAPKQDLTLVTRYVSIAEPRRGALHLVLPGRDAPKLTACRGTIAVTPGPGATVRAVRIGDKRGTSFLLEAADLAIDVELDIAGRMPIAWIQNQALADGWQASLVTVLGPAVKAAAAKRVVFVIDGSRSMDLVGRHNVVKVTDKVIDALGAALPPGSEVEAILYDRNATPLFGELRPATPENLQAISAAVGKRAAGNGSDLVAAFARVHDIVESQPGQTMIVVITDGVTGELADTALTRALGATASAVDVHAIVLDPARTTSPGADALRVPVNTLGGAFVEVNVDRLDHALLAIDEWLRPSWLELRFGDLAIPSELRAGGGFTHLAVHRTTAPGTLSGHTDKTFALPVRAAPAAPLGALALAVPGVGRQIQAAFDKARAAHPAVDEGRAFAVLTASGRVATSRRDMVRGGGRYERVVAAADPDARIVVPAPLAPVIASAIARVTLERLFREQLQPKAFVCYQRALGRNANLSGIAKFKLVMGRGETTAVTLVTGLGDPQLDACLIDAAYLLSPPLPDFTVNADDQTIANYPLAFQRRADQPVIVPGDADSASPLDIDAIEGGVPGRKPIKVDTNTPLGGVKP